VLSEGVDESVGAERGAGLARALLAAVKKGEHDLDGWERERRAILAEAARDDRCARGARLLLGLGEGCGHALPRVDQRDEELGDVGGGVALRAAEGGDEGGDELRLRQPRRRHVARNELRDLAGLGGGGLSHTERGHRLQHRVRPNVQQQPRHQLRQREARGDGGGGGGGGRRRGGGLLALLARLARRRRRRLLRRRRRRPRRREVRLKRVGVGLLQRHQHLPEVAGEHGVYRRRLLQQREELRHLLARLS
jgi:hypothetical protein